MRFVLALFSILMIAKEGFGFNVDFGSRVSGKNVTIVAALLIIASRLVRETRPRVELPAIQIFFVVLIVYAVASWWVASFVVGYERYPIWNNAVLLKILLIDHFLIFLAFFYGPRTLSEVFWILKSLLAVVILAQVVTVGEWSGLLPTNFVSEQDTGRVNGLLGEANQYSLFTAMFVPAMAAMVASGRGASRVFWLSSVALSLFSFFLTLSRGAFVGGLLAAAIWLYLFRRQLSLAAMAGSAMAASAAVAVIAVFLFATPYGYVVYDRLVVDTFQQTSISELSKERTDLWAAAIERMMDHPITMLTGYGWRAYWALPQMLSPHNTYLEAWFNLGLPGLLCKVAIFLLGTTVALRAARGCTGAARPHLMAPVFSILAVAVGLLFTEWYAPWSYFWAYFGLAMRMSVISAGENAVSTPNDVSGDRRPGSQTGLERREQFGWSRSRSERLSNVP